MKDLDAWKMDLTGTSLIEASAGTGKTYTLTTLYLRLLVEEDLLPSEILVVTYTQAATAELRERVRTRIQNAIDAPESSDDSHEAEHLRVLATLARTKSAKSGKPDALRRALQEFDEAAIFTIHGFCQRTLQQNAFESGLAFDTELVEKPEPIERTLSHDLWATLLESEDPLFVEWLLAGAGRRWQFEPEALHRNLLGELGADDEMPIVPAPSVAESLDADGVRGRFLASLRAWAELWIERRSVVADLLLGENDLKRNQFKIVTIENKWLPELDRLARSVGGDDDAVASLEIPECFEKLTTRLLEKGTKKKGTPISDPCFAAFDEVFEAVEALDRALDNRALELRRRFVDEAREQARIRREERHRLFFDDLLSQLRAALQGRGGQGLADLLRERYRFALIDEFQDTDPVQYDIFHDVWHETGKATGRRGLVLIGDPKQAIYSFRGADVFTYLSARSDAGDNAYELPINWRSDPELIAAVNTLFEQRARAFQIDEIEFNPVRPREGHTSSLRLADGSRFAEGSQAAFRVLMADRVVANDFVDEEVSPDKQMPIRFGRTFLMKAVARDIADLLDARPQIDGRPIDPSDIAILCRRKSELQQARRALEALGIPVVDRGDADVFETREAWELVCVLRAMMRSGEPATLRGALSTGAHGLGAGALAALADEAPELAEISERFAEYGRIWSQTGFGRAFETWRRQEKVTQRLLAYDDGERRLTNWLHLAELLQRVASERSPSRSGLVAWLERAIASEEVRSGVGSEASLLRLERDDHAVSLVTLHRSKGLEYPFVYLPSLWEDTTSRGPSVESAEKGKKRNPPIRFHDETTGKRTLDLGGGDAYASHVERSKAEGFSEQLRLLYVGLTRAKHRCVVAWGAIGTAYARSPLAWLVDGAASEAEGLDQKASEQKLRKWTDDDWREAWRRLGEQAGEGAIEVESACFEPRARWQSDTTLLDQLSYSLPNRLFDRPVRTTSFSGLIREGHRTSALLGDSDGVGGSDVTGRDLDANVEGAGPSLADREEGVEVAPDLAADMHEFPRGADAGSLLHEVLEQVDFGRYDEASVKELAVKTLTRNGVDLAHVDRVTHVVDSVARTPLRHTPKPFRLADVEHGQFRPEVEFTLGTPGNGSDISFSPAGLGALLSTSPKGSPLERYAERASRMDFRALNGYLRGFIDAVFCDGERYFLVDYKSNHLGSLQADYRPEALIDPMISHDYVLQYLVYSVALDRHLSCRLADYDYEVHFGGVYYLFLRGLAETHESGCGIYFDRPDFERVRGASRLMGLEEEPRE